MRALGKLFLLLLVIGATVVLWEIIRPGLNPSPRPNPAPYPTPSPSPPPGAQPPPSAGQPTVNLAIVNVRSVQKQGGRYVEVTVLNHGPATATQASGWCSYRCSSTGVAANNLPILQKPHLIPGGSHTGLFSFPPCPDPNLYVECLVQPGHGVQDSSFGDNRWAGYVPTR